MNGVQDEIERGEKFRGMGLRLTENDGIVVGGSLNVEGFGDMAKCEVGSAEGKEKALFLTGGGGRRQKVGRTVTGDGNQTDFDDAYRIVKDKFARL